MSKAVNKFLADQPSLYSLVGANLLVTIIAIFAAWTLGDLLWTFYIQSLIIGWFARKRMLALQNFSTEGFTSNNKPVPENEEGKRSTAGFFVIHFGFFHLVYLIFLFNMAAPKTIVHFIGLLACGVSFWLAQKQTYEMQVDADSRGKPNLGALMFLPYIRIIPIHISIILGFVAQSTIGILFFMTLKTFADIGLDRLDRYMARKALVAEKQRVGGE